MLEVEPWGWAKYSVYMSHERQVSTNVQIHSDEKYSDRHALSFSSLLPPRVGLDPVYTGQCSATVAVAARLPEAPRRARRGGEELHEGARRARAAAALNELRCSCHALCVIIRYRMCSPEPL